MGEKDKRPIYQPPRARDLSSSTVSGFPQPRGLCVAGTALEYPGVCSPGDNPVGGQFQCKPNGLAPEYGKCDKGNNASQGCISGGVP